MRGEFLSIGALATYTDVIRSPLVGRHLPILARAAREIGGVQIPHWAPPSMTKASWSGCVPPSDSIVSTFRPRTWAKGTRQELTGSLSTSTVQAPHSPSPHPSFVPVNAHS